MESKEPAEIEVELREILREYVRYPERPIRSGDHLTFDLEIDGDDASFDLIPQIHRHFGINPTARAWERAATVADVVALVERWQQATPEERAEAEAECESFAAARRRDDLRLLAVLGVAAGVQLAGRSGIVLLVVASLLFWLWNLPALRRDSRRIPRGRQRALPVLDGFQRALAGEGEDDAAVQDAERIEHILHHAKRSRGASPLLLRCSWTEVVRGYGFHAGVCIPLEKGRGIVTLAWTWISSSWLRSDERATTHSPSGDQSSPVS